METVLSRLHTLTPDQLRQETMAAGLKCGPVTATTRAIFEKRLARALLERGGAELGPAQQEPPRGEGRGSEPSPDLRSPKGVGESSAASCGDTDGILPECPRIFYGVWPQREESAGDTEDRVRVYLDKKKALRAMINLKGSRFKGFPTWEEAKEFSRGSHEKIISPLCASTPVSLPSSNTPGAAHSSNTPSAAHSSNTPVSPPSTNSPVAPHRILESVTDTGSPGSGELSAGNPEKANEFRSPRTQELTAKLRRAVEEGDREAFSSLVWSNPRYLIGSGDNPTIVHEGCHYNVLHVAAKENQAGVAQQLLDTLQTPNFMRLMYPDDQDAMLNQRIRYLVDLYLNTPDKTNNETPLHFACKFGCPEVVNVLCSHPATDKHRRNKYGQVPSSVVCERKKNKTAQMKKTIQDYLEDRCFVPLLRDTDNSVQPVIGIPWSPMPVEEDSYWLAGGAAGSPIDPIMTLRAYVGPIGPLKAEEFYRLWRTPSRERGGYYHHILKSDPDRGVERVGREIANNMGYPWAEYWDFLDSYVDLSSEEGLRLLEEHLDKRNKDNHFLSEDNHFPSDASDPPESPAVSDRSSPPMEKSSQAAVRDLLHDFERDSVPEGQGSPENQGEEVEEKVRGQGEAVKVVDSCPTLPGPEGVDLGDGSSWSSWWRSGARAEEELSVASTCSEEYLTADEGSEDFENPRGDGRDRRGSESSYSSYASTRDTSGTTLLTTDTPPSGRTAFIQGSSPSKLDREVLAVVEDLQIDRDMHPSIATWMDTVQAFSPTQRQSWPSPMRGVKDPQTSSPSRLASLWPAGPSSPSSPGFHTPTRSPYTQHVLCSSVFRTGPHTDSTTTAGQGVPFAKPV